VERPGKARMDWRVYNVHAHKHTRVRACEEHIFFHTRVITARSVMVAEKVVSSVNTQLIGKRGSKRMT